MGILADAFLLVVDPILTITVDPVRRNIRARKEENGIPLKVGDYGSISSNTGDDTLIARNCVLFWLVYPHMNGVETAKFVGTEKMLRILNKERDTAAYPEGRCIPANDIANFCPIGFRKEQAPNTPAPA